MRFIQSEPRGARVCALWFGLAFGVLLLARAPFLFVQYIPHAVPFEPASPLIPLFGVMWGPPAFLAVALASLAGDALAGMGDAGAVFRAIGAMLYAWSARALWCAASGWGSMTREPPMGWAPAFRFVMVAGPGCVLYATWTALGADALRWYPFAYVAMVALIHHALFLGVLGVIIYRGAMRDVLPHCGAWCDPCAEADSAASWSWRRVIGLTAGAIGALGVGLALSYRSGHPAWPPAMMGDAAGPVLWLAMLPFIALQIMGLAGGRFKKRV